MADLEHVFVPWSEAGKLMYRLYKMIFGPEYEVFEITVFSDEHEYRNLS